jgi:hypothetical protein
MWGYSVVSFFSRSSRSTVLSRSSFYWYYYCTSWFSLLSICTIYIEEHPSVTFSWDIV